MNRREALLLLAGTAALPESLKAMGRAVHARVRAGTLRTFTAHQNETVATIAELIIPKTDTPGARDAGVPAFIDVMVADWGDDEQRQMFTTGLANVDERSRTAYEKNSSAARRSSRVRFCRISTTSWLGCAMRRATPRKISSAP